MAASQMLIILAYKHATAGRIAPFNYTVVIFSGLIGWMVWHNTPDLLVAGRRSAGHSGRRTEHQVRWSEFQWPLGLAGLLESSFAITSKPHERTDHLWRKYPMRAPVAGDRWRISRLASGRSEPLLGRYPEQTDPSFHPASGANQTFDLPEIVTCIALRAAGGLVLTLRKHFATFDTGDIEAGTARRGGTRSARQSFQ